MGLPERVSLHDQPDAPAKVLALVPAGGAQEAVTACGLPDIEAAAEAVRYLRGLVDVADRPSGELAEACFGLITRLARDAKAAQADGDTSAAEHLCSLLAEARIEWGRAVSPPHPDSEPEAAALAEARRDARLSAECAAAAAESSGSDWAVWKAQCAAEAAREAQQAATSKVARSCAEDAFFAERDAVSAASWPGWNPDDDARQVAYRGVS